MSQTLHDESQIHPLEWWRVIRQDQKVCKMYCNIKCNTQIDLFKSVSVLCTAFVQQGELDCYSLLGTPQSGVARTIKSNLTNSQQNLSQLLHTCQLANTPQVVTITTHPFYGKMWLNGNKWLHNLSHLPLILIRRRHEQQYFQCVYWSYSVTKVTKALLQLL